MRVDSFRYSGLDVVRVLAVVLVSFAHFTYTAHHRLNIEGVYNKELLIPSNEWAFLIPDQVLSSYFSTYLGTIGVSLFFITTGYLMPLMLERYSRREFLLNRVFRIFPTLGVSVLITWGAVSLLHGERFDIFNFWHSVFLTFWFWGVTPIIPVLWTLVIEIFFYLFCFILGRFSPFKLLYSMGIITLLFSMAHFWHLSPLEYILKYFLIIFTGSSIYFIRTSQAMQWKNFLILGMSIALWYLAFLLTEPTSGYAHFATIFISIGIVLFFLFYSFRVPKFITYLANMVYPLYLLHFTFGLNMMLLVKHFFGVHEYFMILAAYMVVIMMSSLVHRWVEEPFYFYIKQYMRSR